MVRLYCFLRLNLNTIIFVAASVLGDGALHAGIGQRRASRHFVGIVHHRQHAAEFHLGADIAR